MTEQQQLSILNNNSVCVCVALKGGKSSNTKILLLRLVTAFEIYKSENIYKIMKILE